MIKLIFKILILTLLAPQVFAQVKILGGAKIQNSGSISLVRDAADPYLGNVVLWIQPNSTDSTIVDLSSSNKTVTPVGNAALSTAVTDPWGRSNKVIAFDGTGDYLSIADSAD